MESYSAWAALGGIEGVLKTLSGQDDVNPNTPDANGEVPLTRGVWNGHEGAAKVLLGQDDINPNKLTWNDQTPLSLAACRGRERVVKC